MSKGKSSIDRNLILLIALFSIMLIACIVLTIMVSKKDEALQGADQAIRLSAQGGFECEYAEAQKLYAFGEGILKVTDSRVAYLTLSGNEVFSKNVSYSTPQCYVKNDRAVVFDQDGYGFIVLNTEEVLVEMPTSNKIKSAILSNDGICAVITDSDEAYGMVTMYSITGSVISEWTSYNSGYPIACAFTPEDDCLAVTTVNTTGAVVKPYIRLFSIIPTDNGTTAEDYAVYTMDDTDIFSAVLYCGSRLYTFSSNKIYTIENDVVTPLEGEYGSINQVNAVGNSLFVVYADGVDQMNKLAIIGNNGDTVYNSAVGSEINAVSVTDNLYALSIDRRIYVFNKDGDIISDISVDEDVLKIGFIGNNKLVVISTGGVHTVDY